jgi:hypothetical protein
MPLKKLLPLLLVSIPVLADQCVLQQKTVTRSAAVIQERDRVRAEIVPSFNNRIKCMVNFRAKIDNAWHTAFGEHEWAGNYSREQACDIAIKRAEDSVQERVQQSRVVSEKTLVCREDPKLETLQTTVPGTAGVKSQFRPHPDRPNQFWHNGAPCQYFLESNFTGRDIRTFEGIICRIQNNQWVVVDKF